MASKIELVEKYRGEFISYHRIQHEVAWRRKPLAVAHSVIASHLNILTEGLTQEDFHKVVRRHGLEVNQDFVDPFALVAEQYRLAAKNELPDAESAAVFWWGVDANMARAESRSGCTLGEVRSAISKAEKAEESRDVGLFGTNLRRCATFETLSKLTAEHYKNESDSFTLPQVRIVRQTSKSLLKIGDKIICEDYDALEAEERKYYAGRDKMRTSKQIDISNVEKEHDPSLDGVLPKLEILCIRELHKSGNEFAQGESDGSVIYCKTVMDKAKKGRCNCLSKSIIAAALAYS